MYAGMQIKTSQNKSAQQHLSDAYLVAVAGMEAEPL
jgi:hypothetical protein